MAMSKQQQYNEKMEKEGKGNSKGNSKAGKKSNSNKGKKKNNPFANMMKGK